MNNPEISVNIGDVISTLRTFVRRNESSSLVKMRWIAAFMQDAFIPRLERVAAGTMNREDEAALAEFRRGEILAEIEKRQKEILALDEEARKLTLIE